MEKKPKPRFYQHVESNYPGPEGEGISFYEDNAEINQMIKECCRSKTKDRKWAKRKSDSYEGY